MAAAHASALFHRCRRREGDASCDERRTEGSGLGPDSCEAEHCRSREPGASAPEARTAERRERAEGESLE
ncbi:hypothetical protein [Chlorobium sp. N1]|uniref:hypothetical protein n=1 Tax=Chlorobium sp. N1 TaxID=2491138 RepID=UPI00103CF26B|nr:hypothetical protein [Chlorobium sp. N1]TCD48243.1 hypothetical protein E0L29_05020 [Chlorobium sp. N1]